MPDLYELTKQLEEGDNLAWVAEKSINDVDRTHPHTITNIEHEENMIKVEGEGIKGGEFYYKVYPDGESEAFFVNPAKEDPVRKGSVAFAELTDSDMVMVKPGVYDSR